MPLSTEEQATSEIKKAFSFSSFHSGLLKLAILRILSMRPMHGYALIKEIERMSEGTWKPSPGSIYPALDALMKAGIISQETVGRKLVYRLTPEGQKVLSQIMDHAKTAVKSIQGLLDYKPTGNT